MFKDKPLYYNYFFNSIILLLTGCIFAFLIFIFNGNYIPALIIFGSQAILHAIFGFVKYKKR